MTNALPAAPAQDPRIAELLAQLHDPVTPPAIGLWPPAIGWWILAALIVAGIVFALTHWKKHKANSTYRKQALAELSALENEKNAHILALNTAALLKRVCLTAYPASSSAGYTGDRWMQLIKQALKDKKLTDEHQNALTVLTGELKYQANCDYNSHELIEACRYWIKHHKQLTLQEQQQISSNINSFILKGAN